ncbi:MAG: hypothetical protein HZA02_06830 [Nitrospinae bacterium]|nr:hypothetical protein [Nitrospinota bacterium]
MIGETAFHPFISHFSPALFVAGAAALFLAKKRGQPELAWAASLNFSVGLLAVMLAAFSGMIAVDIGRFTSEQAEGHQGYSFLFVILYGICAVYSYTRAYSSTAVLFYVLNFLAMAASVYSGYRLVFF